MKIETGQGTIALSTLLAIWSISLVVNLPGLAITPILGNVEAVFPHTSELEVQMLTILPNLFIIPFVLLSGKLSVSKNKIGILTVALIIYLISGIAYFFAGSMLELIVISCLLGVGCGTIQPIVYDKAVECSSGRQSTLALALVLAMNYTAVTLMPFIVDLFKWIFDAHGNLFPYTLNSAIMGILFLLSVVLARKFMFSVNRHYS